MSEPKTEAPAIRDAEAQLAELVRVSAELVGTIERGDDHLTVLRAASAVNQRMAAIENEQARAPASSRFLDVVRAARGWRSWSDDGEGYIEAEATLAAAVDALEGASGQRQ